MIPSWLHWLSVASLCLGAICAVLLALDLSRRPPPMRIMALVWPICALFGSVAVLWLYAAHGRAPPHGGMDRHHDDDDRTPFAASVATGALHCGSGCTLGDVCGEALLLGVPQLAVLLGYPTLFGDRMFAGWMLDLVFAYGFGILFQFFAIAPMRGLSLRDGLVAAIKADTLSLIAWQVGMFGCMAVAQFALFRPLLGVTLRADDAGFWFVMQIAMACGFATAFPMNWWLIRAGLKEAM